MNTYYQTPTISVLMSVHNDAEYLEDAIESILNQTYRDFEFLITDDCSQDGGRSIIQSYACKEKRVTAFINEENQGLTASLNDMLNQARGQFIARMDADDISRSRRFEKQVDCLKSDPSVDVVFSNTRFIDKHGEPVCVAWRPEGKDIVEQIGRRCYIPHPTVMLRTSAIREVGGYDESYWTGQDHDLWQRLKANSASFRYLPGVLLDYRVDPDSVRAEYDGDYWFKVSNMCIWNRDRMKSLAYLGRLTLWQQVQILAKMFVPHFIMRYRGG
jgi:glycosyltransferase involved in cell wall biosynthesis